ncbi:ubiquitin ligase scf complex subunit cullin [Moniliophthora roreri]|nr:ubiquitin ligase scf complex subunit cullin [Moniliophthora roreri]
MATGLRKKTKIKPPKKYGPDVSIDETWADLSKNIREILNRDNVSNMSFEVNHRYAYNMVLYKAGDKLYNGTKQIISEKLDQLASDEVIPAFPATNSNDSMTRSQENEVLLKVLKRIWDDHTSNMVKLGQILKYMDRYYTKTAELPETWEFGLSLFLKHIIRPPIKEHLITAILNQVEFEREGYMINRSAVKGCVEVFLSLEEQGSSVYKRELEPVILEESAKFYRNLAQNLLDTCDAPQYLERAEERFMSEESRTHYYLSRQTAVPLQQILLNHLLSAHLEPIISMPNSGLDPMIDNDRIEDLARLYKLYTLVPQGLPCLKKALKKSIAWRGKDINQSSLGGEVTQEASEDIDRVKDTAKATAKAKSFSSGAQTLASALKWVQDVLDLKDKFDRVWKESFQGDRELEGALNEVRIILFPLITIAHEERQAFGAFINSNDKSSEFISLFIDDHLKRGLKGKTDADVDIVLEKTITVFRYLTEKDVFERYYKSHLAKRLLLGRSVSDDAERGMLAKLKIECGYQFTQKLEGMFHDMKISADHMEEYKQKVALYPPTPVEISVIVMTSTFWPMTHSASPCNLPDQLLKATQSFEQFYLKKHTGRRLTWQLSLGNADVRVAFKNKKYDLNVATFALVILLLFEDLDDEGFLTYEEIKQATSIEDSDLQRHLQSLACAKYKVLKKHPPGRDVLPTDSFSFNFGFTANLQKIKISTVSSKVESGEERKETRDRIDEERRHQTEACIVRIMKDRKHMTHNDLINEVTRLLSSRFQPNPLIIKKRIEGLIDREYLERCEDRKSYNYLA